MSQDGKPSLLRHLLGLAVAAGLKWLLVILWSYGPIFLRGTAFQDLFTIAYVVAAFGILTLTERIASAWTGP
ncbi:hypothetical protein [Rhizobium sp. 18065]|uniref:hypothetical protein n=1 Tax=Rhizobium sp. 18065 TaxID=2681411 RepID=UPI00135C8A87|nr:hypothetical protein [Rhizobium sp. 18065]